MAVTGVGLVSPVGLTARENWASLTAGVSGIGMITRFDATDYACRIAGEVKGFDPGAFLEKKEVKKFDTFIHFAVAAAKEAMTDSGLAVTPENAERVGVCIGSGIGGLPLIEETHKTVLEKGPRRISPFFIPGLIVNMCCGTRLDPDRREGPEFGHGHGLRDVGPCDRRRGERHPPRGRRRDDRGRLGGRHHDARGGRFLGDARPLDA